MKTLKDVFEELRGSDNKKILLLGNGFNIAAGDYLNGLNYLSLIDRIQKKLEENSSLRKFLEECINNKRSNLEVFLEYFNMACICIKYFENSNYFQGKNGISSVAEIIEKDIRILKNETLAMIKEIHPNNYEEEKEIFDICSENIGIFDFIFTVNYDLILYWLIMIYNTNRGCCKFRDGMSHRDRDFEFDSKKFNLKKWSCVNNSYNVFYLHGAIHLIEDSDSKDTFKVARKAGKSESLRMLIEALLNEFSKYKNLIVFEGSDKEKIFRINHNEYLKEGLMQLSRKCGDLVVYGCSIINDDGTLNNDRHIWEAIMRNQKIKNIYIGLYFSDAIDFENEEERIRSALIGNYEETRNIIFFTTKDIDIWHTKL